MFLVYLICFICVSRLAGSEEEEEEGEWKLYFKLYCFLDVESVPKEGVEFAFMFEQVGFMLRVDMERIIRQYLTAALLLVEGP